jgi:hypothetical protein
MAINAEPESPSPTKFKVVPRGAPVLDEFEQMANGARRDHIAEEPIADLFMSVLDTDSRNGAFVWAVGLLAGRGFSTR